MTPAVKDGREQPADGAESFAPRRRMWRKFRGNRLALAGLAVVVIIGLLGVLAPWLPLPGPNVTHFTQAFHPPSAAHPFGTDDLGRDILSRVIYGARTSMGASLIIVGWGLAVGVPIGLLAGFVGGWVDDVIMRMVDAALAFPALVLAMAIAWLLGPSLADAIIAISVVTIPQFARITRGQVLSLREREYVEAARCLGASPVRIMYGHILPNAATPIVVVATLNVGSAILGLASLSFLGLGPPPPSPNWGAILEEGAQYLNMAPWISLFPGLVIFVSVLGFNLLGDGIRDVFDPHSR